MGSDEKHISQKGNRTVQYCLCIIIARQVQGSLSSTLGWICFRKSRRRTRGEETERELDVRRTERELSISLLPHSCLPKRSFMDLSPLKLHLVPRWTIIFSHRDILPMSMSFLHTAATATGSVSLPFFFLYSPPVFLYLSLSISYSAILVRSPSHPPFRMPSMNNLIIYLSFAFCDL